MVSDSSLSRREWLFLKLVYVTLASVEYSNARCTSTAIRCSSSESMFTVLAVQTSHISYMPNGFRARFGTSRRSIAMMFVRPSVCLSVCLPGTGMYCHHMAHFSADLSLWLDSPLFWEP